MGLSVHDPFVDPLGNPLGLARSSGSGYEALLNDPVIIDFNSNSRLTGTWLVPKDYKFIRVSAVGAGGGGRGGGGGFTQTKILKVKPGMTVEYSTAPLSSALGSGTNTTASVLDYALLATGGGASVSGSAGGGAGGPRGNGGDGGYGQNANGQASYTGGGGGGNITTNGSYSGGGGVGASGGTAQVGVGGGANTGWGSPGVGTAGGNWGGGGGFNGTGGAGGVRIELW